MRKIVALCPIGQKVRIFVLIAISASLAGAILPARANGLHHFYGEAFLQTCLWYGCGISSEIGTGANIQINNMTVDSSTVAVWVSLDSWSNGHQWVQTGYAIGNLPDGTFTSMPIFYGEYQTSTSYTFYNF